MIVVWFPLCHSKKRLEDKMNELLNERGPLSGEENKLRNRKAYIWLIPGFVLLKSWISQFSYGLDKDLIQFLLLG